MKKNKRIYLDYGASTPLDPKVKKEMEEVGSLYENPSALYGEGRSAADVLQKYREKAAHVLNAHPRELIFTASGTESNNLALQGVLRAHDSKKPHHVILSDIEHSSVREVGKYFANRGKKVDTLAVDAQGTVDLEAFKKKLRKDTVLVSVMYVNNEIGSIQPIAEIAKILRKHRKKYGTKTPYFHTDACQAGNYLPLNVKKLGVDLLSLNGSKIYGPKGTGLLYIKKGTPMEPLMYGGGQEYGLRSSTENLAGIAGLTEALVQAGKKREKESARLRKIREYALIEMKKKISNIHINTPTNAIPNNIHVSFLGADAESVVLYLDAQGYAAATGAACSAITAKTSHVLRACKATEDVLKGGVRLSMGRSTKKEDIKSLIKALAHILPKIRE